MVIISVEQIAERVEVELERLRAARPALSLRAFNGQSA